MSSSSSSIDNELRTAMANRVLWLLKCPRVVSNAWQSIAAETSSSFSSPPPAPSRGASPYAAATALRPIVGKIVVIIDPLDLDPSSIPQESMQKFQLEGKNSVEGKVAYKFDMMPHGESFAQYGKMCRERKKEAAAKTRQVQYKPKPSPPKGSELKRSRMDRKNLEAIIFKLFERQSNWGLEPLIQETDQPEEYLREVLSCLCIYNKKGPNSGTYEIKPEFKRSTSCFH